MISIALQAIALFAFRGDAIASIKKMLSYQALYVNAYAIGNDGLNFGHSLWGLLKVFLVSFHVFIPHKLWFIIYDVLIVALLLYVFYIFYSKKFLDWQEIFVVCSISSLCPFVSADYKLIYFIIPFVMFFVSKTNRFRDFDRAYSFLFVLLMVPKNIPMKYFINSFPFDISYAVISNPIIILIFCMLFVIDIKKNV